MAYLVSLAGLTILVGDETKEQSGILGVTDCRRFMGWRGYG